MTDKTLKLSRPLKFGEKILNELVIKEPTAGHLMDHGIPFTQDGVNVAASGKLLEACSGVHLPVLKKMSGKDMLKAIGVLAEFINTDDGAIDEGNSTASQPT